MTAIAAEFIFEILATEHVDFSNTPLYIYHFMVKFSGCFNLQILKILHRVGRDPSSERVCIDKPSSERMKWTVAVKRVMLLILDHQIVGWHWIRTHCCFLQIVRRCRCYLLHPAGWWITGRLIDRWLLLLFLTSLQINVFCYFLLARWPNSHQYALHRAIPVYLIERRRLLDNIILSSLRTNLIKLETS